MVTKSDLLLVVEEILVRGLEPAILWREWVVGICNSFDAVVLKPKFLPSQSLLLSYVGNTERVNSIGTVEIPVSRWVLLYVLPAALCPSAWD